MKSLWKTDHTLETNKISDEKSTALFLVGVSTKRVLDGANYPAAFVLLPGGFYISLHQVSFSLYFVAFMTFQATKLRKTGRLSNTLFSVFISYKISGMKILKCMSRIHMYRARCLVTSHVAESNK